MSTPSSVRARRGSVSNANDAAIAGASKTPKSKSEKTSSSSTATTVTSSSTAVLPYLTFLISLTAIPTMWALNTYKLSSTSLGLLIVGASVCGVVVVLPMYINPNKPWQYYLFTLFAFTSMVDLVLALTAWGFTSAGDFYLNDGEPYLRASHSAFINTWDATGHLLCYYYFTHVYNNTKKSSSSSRGLDAVTLWWAGSVINSLLVLLPSIPLGRYGEHVKPSILLNVPYVAFPLYFIFAHARPGFSSSSSRAGGGVSMWTKISTGTFSWRKELEAIVFCDFFFVSACMMIFRALAGMGAPAAMFKDYLAAGEPYLLDSAKFPLVQSLLYAFYASPILIFISYLLWKEGGAYSRIASLYPWLVNVTLVLAGGLAQGQLAYLGGWLVKCGPSCGQGYDEYVEPTWSGIPFYIALVFNVGIDILPQWFAFRLYSSA